VLYPEEKKLSLNAYILLDAALYRSFHMQH